MRSDPTLHRPRALRMGLRAAVLLALLSPAGVHAASVILRWTAPGDDGSVGIASSYELRYSESTVPSDTASWWSAAVVAGPLAPPRPSGSAESFAVAGLDSGRTYYFVIRAADEVPNWSGFSNVAVKVTTPVVGPLVSPSNFTAIAVTGGVLLSWSEVTAGAALGYRLYRSMLPSQVGSLVLTAPLTQTSWRDTTVTGGQTYAYSLVTYSGAAESVPPASVDISLPGDLLETLSDVLRGYPNPGRHKVTLRFRAGAEDGSPGPVRLFVYDLTGHLIARLVDEVLPAGELAVDWTCRSDQGNPVAPGLYTAILDTPRGRLTTRIAILP